MFGLFKKKPAEAPPVEAQEPDYATLYVPDPSLLGSKVLDKLKGLQSHEGISQGDAATGLRLRFKPGEVEMNFMPPHRIEEHLAGMMGYAEKAVGDPQRLPQVLARIREIRFVIGCRIIPGFDDDDDTILNALFELTGQLNGMLFLGDSLFSPDGEPLAGSACEA